MGAAGSEKMPAPDSPAPDTLRRGRGSCLQSRLSPLSTFLPPLPSRLSATGELQKPSHSAVIGTHKTAEE